MKALQVLPESGLGGPECCLRISLLPLRLNIDQVTRLPIYAALSTFHEIFINVVGHFNRLTCCLEYSETSYSWEKPSDSKAYTLKLMHVEAGG